LWKDVDEGRFDGLTRNGLPITKTYGGDNKALMLTVKAPPVTSTTKAMKDKDEDH
jgi:hypothetical protein